MHLRISSTGVRNGEYVTSSPGAKQNTGTIMQLRGISPNNVAYPPLLPWVANLDIAEIRDQLRQIPFFAPMTEEQRLVWLRDNGNTHKDLYMDDVKGLQVRFIKIGGKFMLDSLSTEQIDALVRGNPRDAQGFYPIEEVMAMFPRKSSKGGPRGGKVTLVFRPNNWVLLPDQITASSFSGLYLNVDTLTLASGTVSKPANGQMIITKGSSGAAGYALLFSSRTTPLTWAHCLSLAPSVLHTQMEQWRSIIAWSSPALLKSIVQKIIRTRCTYVLCGEDADDRSIVKVQAGAALLTAFSLLLLHAGSFVPNIQRFVTGTESAFKRSAVSIFEDSYMEDGRALMGMLACGQLAQHQEKWQPTDEHIRNAMNALLLAQQERRIFDYVNDASLGEVKSMTPWVMSAILLNELKSFETDIGMVNSIAANNGRARLTTAPDVKSEMNIIHAVDQHTWTEIAHYIPTYKGQPVKEYKEVFSAIWSNVVGINPRWNRYQVNLEEAKIIQHAQRILWIVKAREAGVLPAQIQRPLTDKMIDFTYELPSSWLAGLVGHIETSKGIAVLGTDDIQRLIAIRRPSRDAKDKGDLSETEKASVIEEAKEQLIGGLRLRHVPTTLSQLDGATVYLKDDGYYLRLANNETASWSEFCRMSFRFNTHPSAPASLEQALTYDGDGIMIGADAAFARLLTLISSATISRLLTYLVGSHSTIILNKIGRDGDGVDYAVTPEDTNVNYTLGILCCLYPAALVKSGTGFTVKNGPLLWSLRERIQRASLTKYNLDDGKEGKGVWPQPQRPQRALWEHQIDSLNEMKERHLQGHRLNALWLEMGLGKTGIAIEYLVWLIESKLMYDYCIVTVPPSAVASWVKELDMYALPHQVLDMRAKSKVTELKTGIVNIVWHDHLRLGDMPEQLQKKAPYALLIVDEFHKTMAHTIRSSLAIEAARLSADCIAMTGTLIRGTDNKELVPWLEQVVDFEIDLTAGSGGGNIFTAIGALVSRKATTKVIVERKTVEAKLEKPEEYYSLVPKNLGGNAVRINFRAALDLSYAAADAEVLRAILYYVAQREPVFVIARTGRVQEEYKNKLERSGVKDIFLIGKGKTLTMGPEEKSPYAVVITTPHYAEGYSLSNIRVGISTVFLSNQATRSQLDARLNRGNQKYPSILLITIHAGILTYIMKKYEEARSLAAALKGLAQEVGADNVKELLI